MNALSVVRRVSITAADDVAEGIRRLRLAAVDGESLAVWEPGAHIDLVLPSGLVRQYSLCGSPADLDSYEIAVLREVAGRGGSAEVHDLLAVGDEVSIAGPRNRFPLHDAPSYVFVAGGIGITPILPMIEAAERAGREWRLVYGGRSLSTMAFLDRLSAWPENVSVLPQDEFGLLDLENLLAPASDTLVYCCGPEPLLNAVELQCDRDWDAGTLNVERFSATEGAVELGDDESTFEVQLGENGPIVEIPADKSILHTLLDAGADLLYSCEEGTCGSCETQVISGTPDHRDSLLSEESREMGCMLICVSRSCDKRLVLDIEAPAELEIASLKSGSSAR